MKRRGQALRRDRSERALRAHLLGEMLNLVADDLEELLDLLQLLLLGPFQLLELLQLLRDALEQLYHLRQRHCGVVRADPLIRTTSRRRKRVPDTKRTDGHVTSFRMFGGGALAALRTLAALRICKDHRSWRCRPGAQALSANVASIR